MEKVALILLSTLILSGCSSYGMQGNSAAVQAGAAIGGVLGAIVGCLLYTSPSPRDCS